MTPMARSVTTSGTTWTLELCALSLATIVGHAIHLYHNDDYYDTIRG